MKPLKGIKAVDLSRLLPGTYDLNKTVTNTHELFFSISGSKMRQKSLVNHRHYKKLRQFEF